MTAFRETHSFETRMAEAIRVKQKYPDRVPVILSYGVHSTIPNMEKNKFLVPSNITIGEFISVVRKRLCMTEESAIFLFIRNHIPPMSCTMAELYSKYTDTDGFLYITYSDEATFG